MSVWTCARSQMFPGNRVEAIARQEGVGVWREEKEGAEPRQPWISCLHRFIPTLRDFNWPVKKKLKKKKQKKPLDRTATRVTLEDVDPSAAPALSRHSCFLSALWTCFRLEAKQSKGKAAGAAIKSVCLLIFIFFGQKRKRSRRGGRKRKTRFTNSHLTRTQVDTDIRLY